MVVVVVVAGDLVDLGAAAADADADADAAVLADDESWADGTSASLQALKENLVFLVTVGQMQ